jgi:hypothetical protein
MRRIFVHWTEDPFLSDFDGLVENHLLVCQAHAPSAGWMEAEMGWNEGVPVLSSGCQQTPKSRKRIA